MSARAVVQMLKAVRIKLLLCGWMLFASMVPGNSTVEGCTTVIGDWYEVRELRKNLFAVSEPDHVTFFILRHENKAILIDSGLGLNPKLSKQLLEHLKIDEFTVLCTHLHCDHVGMNAMARAVYANEVEWKKYLAQKEDEEFLLNYYDMMKVEGARWPPGMPIPPRQEKWQIAGFITDKSEFKLGPWHLRPITLPGHSKGHLGFYESSQHAVFAGDHIYDGHLYLNLRDSSISECLTSMDTLAAYLKPEAGKPAPLLLPAHNSIPLNPQYLEPTRRLLKDIVDGKVEPTEIYPQNKLLLGGFLYRRDNVKVLIRGNDPSLPRKPGGKK